MLPVTFNGVTLISAPMSKPVALVVAPLAIELLQPLTPYFSLVKWAELSDPKAYLQSQGAGIQVLITNGVIGLPPGSADHLPALKLVACNGVGYDAIDLEWAAQRGIAVTNTPDVLSADVADLALALLLAVFRQIPVADRFVREGSWSKGALPLGRRLGGSRVGIIGLGNIGKLIASRCAAFDTQIAYTGRQVQEGISYAFFDSPIALAQWSDALIVATPGGDATRHLVNAPVLDALGPRGVFINISRGSVVDEQALIDHLTTGAIAGAGLDVFAHEPNIPPALHLLPNVVLTPHIASATVQTRRAMAELLVENVQALALGKPLPTQVY